MGDGCRLLKLGANRQSGRSSLLDRIGLLQGPSPKPHGGIAVKIPHHSIALKDLMGHDPERIADAPKQLKELIGRLFALARESPQVAKQHRYLGLARREDLFGISCQQRFSHDRCKEWTKRILPTLEQSRLPQCSDSRCR